MPENIIDALGKKVEQAIGDLAVLGMVKDRIVWQVFPFIGPAPDAPTEIAVLWMVGVGVEVPGSGDKLIDHEPVMDPYDHAQVSTAVKKIFERLNPVVGALHKNVQEVVTGKRSAGGLILPS